MPPTIRFHEATEADHAGLTKVWNEVYGKGVIGDASDHKTTPQTYYIGYADDQPAFGVIVHDYNIHVRGKFFKTAGVGAVGTAGQFRGTGVGTECLKRLHQEVTDQGYDLAVLYGFRELFYRRVGYESCSWRWEIRCDVDRLPKLKLDLPVRQIEPKDVTELDDCYEQFLKTFNGSSRRIPELWKNRLGQNPPTIYAFGDPIESYFWCNPDGFFVDLNIGEFAWSTPRGYRNALALIRTLTINKNAAVWNEPPDSPFIAQYTDHGVKTSRARPAMFKVLNPESVLKKLGADSAYQKLVYTDPDLAEPQIIQGSGEGSVETTIQALTQLVMGDPGPQSLIQFGLLQGDTVALESLTQALPRQQAVCMEFF